MKIKISSYKKMENSKLKGIATIQINVDGFPLTINGVKAITSQKGSVFYSMPDKKVVNDMGEEKYYPICCFFDKEGYKAFHAAMNLAFTEFFKKEQTAPMQAAPQQTMSYPSLDDDLPF